MLKAKVVSGFYMGGKRYYEGAIIELSKVAFAELKATGRVVAARTDTLVPPMQKTREKLS